MIPTKQFKYMQWTYFDEKEMSTKIKPDAPKQIIRAWEQYIKMFEVLIEKQ